MFGAWSDAFSGICVGLSSPAFALRRHRIQSSPSPPGPQGPKPGSRLKTEEEEEGFDLSGHITASHGDQPAHSFLEASFVISSLRVRTTLPSARLQLRDTLSLGPRGCSELPGD